MGIETRVYAVAYLQGREMAEHMFRFTGRCDRFDAADAVRTEIDCDPELRDSAVASAIEGIDDVILEAENLELVA